MAYWLAVVGGAAVGLLPPLGLAALWGVAVAAALAVWFRRAGLVVLFAGLLVSSSNLWDNPLPGRLSDIALGEWWLACLVGLGVIRWAASPIRGDRSTRTGLPWKPFAALVIAGLLSLLWNGAQGWWNPLSWEFAVGGWGLLVLTAAACLLPAALVPDARWGARCLVAAFGAGTLVLLEELWRFLAGGGALRVELANKFIFGGRFPFLGVLSLILLVYAVAVAAAGPRDRWRFAAVAVAWLSGLMALLTVGRAIWLGSIAGLLWMAWRAGRGPVYLVALVVGTSTALFWNILVALYVPSETNWAASRFELWKDAWQIFMAHWPLGAGPGSYYEHARVWESNFLVGSAHNNYLQVAVEIGVAGLAAFAWVVTALWRALDERIRAGGPGLWRAVALGAQAVLVGLLVASCFGDFLLVSVTNSGLDTFCTIGYFWLLAGLALASRRWSPAPAAAPA